MNDQFPDYKNDLHIPKDWEDTSYRNDVCPSYSVTAKNNELLRISTDYKDADKREVDYSLRFAVSFQSREYEYLREGIETDEWNEVLEFVKEHRARAAYVTMTDKAMSDWGKSSGLTNKLVFVCHEYSEAVIVYNNAMARNDMNHVTINRQKPSIYRTTMGADYQLKNQFVQIKTIEDYPAWYKAGYFSE